MKSAAVALWVALQLVVGAPARAVAPSPQRDGQVTTDGSRDVAVVRTSDRPLHRLSLQTPPFVASQRPSTVPPDCIAGSALRPRTRSIACVRPAPFAGPRGPPRVAVS